MVFNYRRTIVECCLEIRHGDVNLEPTGLPLIGLGLQRPIRGLSLDSILEKERLARWLVRIPSRSCTGLADIPYSVAGDSTLWSSSDVDDK